MEIPASVAIIDRYAFTHVEDVYFYHTTTPEFDAEAITNCKPTIHCYHGSGIDTWAQVQGLAVAYLDEISSIPGDPDVDGVVTINDALLILQYGAGQSITLDTDAADVNDDGICDIRDALLILQHEAGWMVELK